MLQELLNDHRSGQDEIQLGSFVLGGRTKWGTYKQAIRELDKRLRGLRQMITDYDLKLIDKEELIDKVNSKEGNKKRRAEIKLRILDSELVLLERSIRDTKREAAVFYRVAKGLKPEFGDLTDGKRYELDKEEWRWWHMKKAYIELQATGRRSELVIKNMLSISNEEKDIWLSILENPKQLSEYVSKCEYGRKVLPEPSTEDIKLVEEEVSCK